MRTLLKVQIPTPAGNKAIREGTLQKTVETLFERLHPEASYFYAEDGRRTALMVFDLKDPAMIPFVSEPAFMGLDACVEMHPVMNAEDLRAGLDKAMKKT